VAVGDDVCVGLSGGGVAVASGMLVGANLGDRVPFTGTGVVSTGVTVATSRT
jgi:hypothetical protein